VLWPQIVQAVVEDVDFARPVDVQELDDVIAEHRSDLGQHTAWRQVAEYFEPIVQHATFGQQVRSGHADRAVERSRVDAPLLFSEGLYAVLGIFDGGGDSGRVLVNLGRRAWSLCTCFLVSGVTLALGAGCCD